MTPVPRVTGKIRRTRPVEVRDMRFLRANTERPAKMTLPGPFTMASRRRTSSIATTRRWCSTSRPR